MTLPSVMCRLSTVKTGQKMASLLLHMTLDQMQKCDQNTFSLSDPKIVKERTIKKLKLKVKYKCEVVVNSTERKTYLIKNWFCRQNVIY